MTLPGDGRSLAALLYGRERPSDREDVNWNPVDGVIHLHPILGQAWLCRACYARDRQITVLSCGPDFEETRPPDFGAPCAGNCGREYGLKEQTP